MDYIVGIIFLILSGIFAWESTMIVHEQKQRRFNKSDVEYRDEDNT
jgi:hypothetical protein